jgi:dTDP-4-dehydrorhamnose reductase
MAGHTSSQQEKSMRVLVTGAKGMLGSDLCPVFGQEYDVVATDIEEMDVRHPQNVLKAARAIQPQLVIHLAAATEVDECERYPDLAYHTNAIGTRNVALACQQVGAEMVYVSTISVFDGTKCTPYTEFDSPNPQSIYSLSKYQGELMVHQLLSRFYIVRAGWMYGGFGEDKKFVSKIISLAKARSVLAVVDDKFGSPTYTLDLSRGLLNLVQSGLYGTYHMVGNGSACSRLEYARAILEAAGISCCRLEGVSSARFPLPAPRPRMEGALNYHLELLGMNDIRPWREALNEYVRALVSES